MDLERGYAKNRIEHEKKKKNQKSLYACPKKARRRANILADDIDNITRSSPELLKKLKFT